MTKAKPETAEDQKPPVDTAPDGQDTLQAQTEDQVEPGADVSPPEAQTTDQTPPLPSEEELAAAAAAKAWEDGAPARAEAKAQAEAAVAEAEAKAQAAAAAAAAAATAAAEAEAKAATRKAKAKKLDLPTLDYCANHIATRNFTGLRAELVEELIDNYGLDIRTNDETGRVTLTMKGITIDPADTMETALTNWGNAARRHIAQATA